MAQPGDDPHEFESSLRVLASVRAAGLDVDARIVPLMGELIPSAPFLIVHNVFLILFGTGFILYWDAVIGYLLEDIPAKIPTLTPVMPDFDDTVFLRPQVPPLFFRQRWMEQLGYTVFQLHASGLTWGRVSPDNIMIDMDDNVWIIPGSHPSSGDYKGWEPWEIEIQARSTGSGYTCA